jgi:hypothetical protein
MHIHTRNATRRSASEKPHEARVHFRRGPVLRHLHQERQRLLAEISSIEAEMTELGYSVGENAECELRHRVEPSLN